MDLKSMLAKPFARVVNRQVKKAAGNAVENQKTIFSELIKKASSTQFGKDHNFHTIKTHADFVQQVPIRGYEEFKPYIEQIKEGKHNVLWRGKPSYFAKTSGTTSGVKYIPLTADSVSNQINAARNALLLFMVESGNFEFSSGKMIFLSGSPELTRVGGIPTGRLSGIVNHHVPGYLRKNQLPTYETNCIEDWEIKLDKIVEETVDQNMTLISGIPPWMQMYFDRLEQKTGKKVGEIFPNLTVLVHGGVNFEPYRARLMASIGREVATVETFPASEGFFAYQDNHTEPGLLLNTYSGIFFEFVPLDEMEKERPERLTLEQVKLGVNYAMVISTNAGLWAYNLGDTIRFTSLDPYKIVVTGRVSHFLSAFGEHVIGEEVEDALAKAAKETGNSITEFTVAPFIAQEEGRSYHEWFIEFESEPNNLEELASKMNDNLRERNIYYDDLQKGNILMPLKITRIRRNGFIDYMKGIGKLGGQNKVPRLSNNRNLADSLKSFVQQ